MEHTTASLRIGIIVGSTRPGRKALDVAQWILAQAATRTGDATFELVDIQDFNLLMTFGVRF